jgi:hypothetical protein
MFELRLFCLMMYVADTKEQVLAHLDFILCSSVEVPGEKGLA